MNSDERYRVIRMVCCAALSLLYLTAAVARLSSEHRNQNPADTLVVIDSAVKGYADLIAEMHSSVSVVLLDPDQDGITQISTHLADSGPFASLHVIAHGSPGKVRLGSTDFGLSTLIKRKKDIAEWKRALNPGSDILLYGCDVASGSGSDFIQTMSGLLEVDVAASSNVTASARNGGDWHLELATGPIEAPTLVNGSLAESTDVVLALPPGFTDELVLDDLTQPVAMAVLPSGEMLVLLRTGTILITDPSDNPAVASTYLVIPNVDMGGEKWIVEHYA